MNKIMEIDDEMYEEEHLDEEPSDETQLLESQEQLLPQQAENKQAARRKLAVLLALHLQNFQTALLTSRRQAQRRIRRRQAMLRAFYLQQMLEVQTCFLEMLPYPGSFADEEAAVDNVNKIVTQNFNSTRTSEEESETTSANLLFYEDIVAQFITEQWLGTFRVTKRTFHWLCGMLRDDMQMMVGKNLISVDKRVALGLYAFATGADEHALATRFNVTRSSVCNYLRNFAETVLDKLGAFLLTMPKKRIEYKEIRKSFRQASNMPALVVGVLGICELKVQPKQGTSDCNKIILQTLIDDKLLFRRVLVRIERPTLFMDAPNEITRLEKQWINKCLLPCFVVAPANCYPLRPWLMHQYNDPVAPHEYDFNEAIDNLNVFKEHAFLRLFGRWQILQRRNDLDSHSMELIATACCALHNLLEERNENFTDGWAANIDLTKFDVCNLQLETNVAPGTQNALEVRDFLARTISSTEM